MDVTHRADDFAIRHQAEKRIRSILIVGTCLLLWITPLAAQFPAASKAQDHGDRQKLLPTQIECESTTGRTDRIPSSNEAQSSYQDSREFCYGLKSGDLEIFTACSNFPINFATPCVERLAGNTKLLVSPLYYALKHHSEPVVEFLLSHGISPHTTLRDYGGTAFRETNPFLLLATEACKNGEAVLPECERLMRRFATIDQQPRALDDALDQALAIHFFSMAELSLKLGANINHRALDGRTPLDDAYLRADSQRIAFLEAHGAERNWEFGVKVATDRAIFYLRCLFGLGCKP